MDVRWAITLLVVLLTLSVGGCDEGGGAGQLKPRPEPTPATGTLPDVIYNAVVKGDFAGTGTMTLSSQVLSISVEVTTDNGEKGTLSASGLVVKNGRFSGAGTVVGKPMRIAGRVDNADANGQVTSLRLLATFGTATGEFGRVVAHKSDTQPAAGGD